jgi:hypothetical protein
MAKMVHSKMNAPYGLALAPPPPRRFGSVLVTFLVTQILVYIVFSSLGATRNAMRAPPLTSLNERRALTKWGRLFRREVNDEHYWPSYNNGGRGVIPNSGYLPCRHRVLAFFER